MKIERRMVKLVEWQRLQREEKAQMRRSLPALSSYKLPDFSTEHRLVNVCDYFPRIDDLLADLWISQAKLVQEAAALAWLAHTGQFRKSGEPYYEHVLATAEIAASWGLGFEEIAAAFCHDLLEDGRINGQRVTTTFLSGKLGIRITDLIQGITELGKEPEFIGEKPSQVEIYRKWLELGSRDLASIVLKLADRLHNMRTLAYADAKTHRKKAEETRNVYAQVADRLGMWKVKRELEDLSMLYLEFDLYQAITEKCQLIVKASSGQIENIIKSLQEVLPGGSLINREIRFIYELKQRLERRNIELEQLSQTDVWRLNVVLPAGSDCCSILGRVHSIYRPDQNEIHDYVNDPQPNGHQFLQTYLNVPGFGLVLVQIRDQKMQAHYELGVAPLLQEHKEASWVVSLLEGLKSEKVISQRDFYDLLARYTKPINIYAERSGPGRREVKVELTSGSTVLDLARKLDEKIFLHADHAIINGRRSELQQQLKEGDVVAIITSTGAQPALGWLNHLHSPEAIISLRQYLAAQNNREILAAAIKALEEVSRKYYLPAVKLLETRLFARYCEQLGLDPHYLIKEIGIGARKAEDEFARIWELYHQESQKIIAAKHRSDYPYYIGILTSDRKGLSDSLIHPLREMGFNIQDVFPVYLGGNGNGTEEQQKVIVILGVDILGGGLALGNLVTEIQRLQVNTIAEIALAENERGEDNIRLLKKADIIKYLEDKTNRLKKK